MNIVSHKIDGIPPQGAAQVGKTPAATTSAGNDKPVSPVAESNPVSLSSEAKTMQALHDQLAQVPEIDVQRVEAVKSAIASGRFTVDPAAVARGLLGMEQALKA